MIVKTHSSPITERRRKRTCSVIRALYYDCSSSSGSGSRAHLLQLLEKEKRDKKSHFSSRFLLWPRFVFAIQQKIVFVRAGGKRGSNNAQRTRMRPKRPPANGFHIAAAAAENYIAPK